MSNWGFQLRHHVMLALCIFSTGHKHLRISAIPGSQINDLIISPRNPQGIMDLFIGGELLGGTGFDVHNPDFIRCSFPEHVR